MVNGYDKVSATKHKVACLVQRVGHCQCLSFHRGIVRVGKTGAHQGDLPAILETEYLARWALAVFLE